MAPLAEVELHQAAVADLATLALRDLLAIWATLDLADATATSDGLQAALPELTAAYASAAGALAADFYDDLRADAPVPSDYTAAPAEPPPAERSRVLARWAVGPLFGAEPDPKTALVRVSGGLQKQVAGAARATVEANVDADPAGPRYSRHASGNACAFCAMLASRGAVYRSEDSAGGRYHDHCHCVVAPLWPGQQLEAPSYVKGWDRAYRGAVSATTEPGKPIDVTKVLAHMRESLGTH